MQHFHSHSRAMKVRFLTVFILAFLGFFSILNIRFLYTSAKFLIAPGTIRAEDSLGKAVKLLPLAQNVSAKPLPNQARLVIDSIGVNAPIVFGVPDDNDLIYKNLEKGVVHYSNTAKPGTKGPSLILGHSSAYPWYRGGYGSVFALLSKLKPGDKFYVQYSDGRLFIFSMRKSIVFNPLAGDARLNELAQNGTSTLILISCWPVGTNYLRIAVQAELVPLE